MTDAGGLTATRDVFSAREIARAAGVPVRIVRQLILTGQVASVPGTRFVGFGEAVAAVRRLRAAEPDTPWRPADRADQLFAIDVAASRRSRVPLAVSSVFHAATLGALVLLTTAGVRSATATNERVDEKRPSRMVFIATPGPGGGGGGGGLRQKAPPPKAERRGTRALSSPLPRREPPKRIEPIPQPRDVPQPAALKPEPLPAIVAPIIASPADVRDRSGVLEDVRAQAESRGPGQGGGVGSGTGTGIGEGEGSGVGTGSGGGTGGGPYRPGSGIEPPRLLREVKPDYTDEARTRGVEGDVELEIVVRSNGTVGDVRIVRGLGAGLDQRAVAAVRQWRFAPARRLNTPVDVIVEVAVEFRLR
jgi:periplasmic protein TonB